MQIRALLEGQQKLLIDHWNEWLGESYLMDERLLHQVTQGHPSWENSKALLAWEAEDLVGFLLGRHHEDLFVIDALAVKPERRRNGIAGQLLESLAPEACRFGGGPSHFVPGVPEDWKAAQDFFQKMGFQKDWSAQDLSLQLSPRKAEYTCVGEGREEAVLSMVAEEFSPRWTEDTRARFEAGDRADVLIIEREGEPVAFCHAWHFESQLLGPSVFWHRHHCPTFGGIGPVGVKKSYRGLGLGAAITEQALNYLYHRGASQIVVDWTSIGPFYEKLGFQNWRRYLGYSRGVEAGL